MHKEFYAEYYRIEDKHWWFVGRRRIFLSLLGKYLPPRMDDGRWTTDHGPKEPLSVPPSSIVHRPSSAAGRPRRILDVGCGTGTMLGYLARFGQAQGIDADEEAVRFCHMRGLTKVTRVDSLPLPFLDGTFDLITALDVIEHIEDDQAMLRELYRVTAPGGLFLFSVPAYRFLWGPQDEISNHKRRYTAPEIRARVVTAGFKIRHLSYCNTLLFPIIAAVRLLRPYKPGSPNLKSDFTLTKPGPANTLLGRLFALEAPLLERVNLPFGVSIVGLAYKV